MGPPVPSLSKDEVHLWLARASTPLAAGAEERIVALMSAEERARLERFHHPEKRGEFLCTRALVRTTLSRYAPLAPGEWSFAQNAHGAPFVSPPSLAPGLLFNLSNTHGLVACAVAKDRAVGVDVEWLHRRGRPLEVADRYFAAAELADLRALPAERQLNRFFDLWTLKEAYIKAVGLGLAIPLGKFAFRFDDDGAIRIAIDPSLGDDGAAWSFQLLSPTPDHRAAIAVRSEQRAIALRTEWTTL